MNKGGFSLKRLFGITSAKRKVSRGLGIPITKSGRQRKAGSGDWLNILLTMFLDN